MQGTSLAHTNGAAACQLSDTVLPFACPAGKRTLLNHVMLCNAAGQANAETCQPCIGPYLQLVSALGVATEHVPT